MKSKCLVLLLCFSVLVFTSAEDTDTSVGNNISWGFSGSIEIGGMSINGEGLNSVKDNNYGTINGDSEVVLFAAGLNYRKPRVYDLALIFSYTSGGSFMWEDIFGDLGSDFSLYSDSLAVQAEFQPLFPWLRGFHPFIGGGYSLTNGLIDNFDDGFVQGQGPFITGGLYILNTLGFDSIPLFYTWDNEFFGIKISVYYRFPYSYNFRMDWDEFSDNYIGLPEDVNAMESFFSNSFSAESITVSIGLSLGYMPF
jgi:hypothetical protein